MAGSATITYIKHTSIKRIQIDWISDAATGAVTIVTKVIDGKILRVVTVPGLAGVQPDDNYNLKLNDEHGIDIANDGLLLRDETNTEMDAPADGENAVCGKLSAVIDSAGNSTQGTIYIYYR